MTEYDTMEIAENILAVLEEQRIALEEILKVAKEFQTRKGGGVKNGYSIIQSISAEVLGKETLQ